MDSLEYIIVALPVDAVKPASSQEGHLSSFLAVFGVSSWRVLLHCVTVLTVDESGRDVAFLTIPVPYHQSRSGRLTLLRPCWSGCVLPRREAIQDIFESLNSLCVSTRLVFGFPSDMRVLCLPIMVTFLSARHVASWGRPFPPARNRLPITPLRADWHVLLSKGSMDNPK